jgi:hypothetical protein
MHSAERHRHARWRGGKALAEFGLWRPPKVAARPFAEVLSRAAASVGDAQARVNAAQRRPQVGGGGAGLPHRRGVVPIPN